MTAPILTGEQVSKAADAHKQRICGAFGCATDFEAGARFALAAAEKREALWRELLQTSEGFCDHGQDCTDCDTDAQVALASRYRELRAALGLEGVR